MKNLKIANKAAVDIAKTDIRCTEPDTARKKFKSPSSAKGFLLQVQMGQPKQLRDMINI